MYLHRANDLRGRISISSPDLEYLHWDVRVCGHSYVDDAPLLVTGFPTSFTLFKYLSEISAPRGRVSTADTSDRRDAFVLVENLFFLKWPFFFLQEGCDQTRYVQKAVAVPVT